MKAKGREDAFVTRMYTVYRSELLRYCSQICGNASDAEDLLQETFAKALSNLDVLERLNESKQRAWLYRVARNLFYDSCRRQAVARRGLPWPEEETEGGFTEVETAMLISLLPPELAQLFVKRYFQGYSAKELAEEYGLSPSGARAALSRARKLLRDKIKE